MSQPGRQKAMRSYRLSAEAQRMLEWLASQSGITQTAVLEQTIRAAARKAKYHERTRRTDDRDYGDSDAGA